MTGESPPPADRLLGIAGQAAELAGRPMPVPPAPRPRPPEPPRSASVDPPRLPRLGLLLAGGAAKGGYEVGVVEALAAHGVEIEAIAGTSIGALNGVVLACAPDLTTGAQRLADLWNDFTERLGTGPFGKNESVTDQHGDVYESLNAGVSNLLPRISRLILNRDHLEWLVTRAIDIDALRTGPPMWVAAFPVPKPPDNLVGRQVRHALDWLRARVHNRASLMRLNDMPGDEVRDTVLASAALPFLFHARSVGGRHFIDGGLGADRVPVRAFANQGCEAIVVVHLNARDVLHERDRDGLRLLEVRPSRSLTAAGLVGGWNGLLDFSPERYQLLRELGFRDATEVLRSYAELVGVRWVRRETQRQMIEAVGELGRPVPQEND
ncbi:hypothetical protein GCM10027290_51260 [Micromonospora sonneratiae]|uniref:Patatin-like phospholipase family protein n=1 Tax=Micromonospora sonneratiae TaxID=1184706 RepID=A0ABW3YBF0_9ACTN